MEIQNRLFELQDKEYAKFQGNLTPGIDLDSIIGVRVPVLRKLAKEYVGTKEADAFIRNLPHEYYDENMLQSILLSAVKNFDECIELVEMFLPYVDNWAVCDTLSPKVFKKYREALMDKIIEWSGSKHTYTCRFGIEMLMTHFLDENFKDEYLEIPAAIHSQDYYVNMMLAWFYATALAKQWDMTIKYLENERLDLWVHNKTIQKARESYRITDEQKAYLKSLKR